jgi:hypothetical protein
MALRYCHSEPQAKNLPLLYKGILRCAQNDSDGNKLLKELPKNREKVFGSRAGLVAFAVYEY